MRNNRVQHLPLVGWCGLPACACGHAACHGYGPRHHGAKPKPARRRLATQTDPAYSVTLSASTTLQVAGRVSPKWRVHITTPPRPIIYKSARRLACSAAPPHNRTPNTASRKSMFRTRLILPLFPVCLDFLFGKRSPDGIMPCRLIGGSGPLPSQPRPGSDRSLCPRHAWTCAAACASREIATKTRASSHPLRLPFAKGSRRSMANTMQSSPPNAKVRARMARVSCKGCLWVRYGLIMKPARTVMRHRNMLALRFDTGSSEPSLQFADGCHGSLTRSLSLRPGLADPLRAAWVGRRIRALPMNGTKSSRTARPARGCC